MIGLKIKTRAVRENRPEARDPDKWFCFNDLFLM